MFSTWGSRLATRPDACLLRGSRHVLSHSRCFSSTHRFFGYEDTIDNLLIGAHTRVLFQGFTGRQATNDAKDSIEWGTNVVGGVKPGFEGEHLGLPVLPSVRAAKEKLKPDASAVYVPGNSVAKAIEEAIEEEIPLVVAVAEFMPIHDLLRIHSMLKTQSKTRFVGANAPGIISTHGRCRIGFHPLPFFQEGKVGIIAKSGTLSYETVASTTRAGVGQSRAISMGGDVLAGTNFVDALKVFENDEKTEGIIMIGEVGGKAEIDAAAWIKEYRRRVANPKPIMGLIAGVRAPPGKIMGHAGAWAAPGEPDSSAKIYALENAGVVVVNHPEKFGDGMKKLLDEQSRSKPTFSAVQKRGSHTLRQRPVPRRNETTSQRRSLYIKSSQAFDMLHERGIKWTEEVSDPVSDFNLSISIDRTNRCPNIVAASTTDSEKSQSWPFDVRTVTPGNLDIAGVASFLQVNEQGQKSIKKLLTELLDIYFKKEAFVLETNVALAGDGQMQIKHARFGFDDAALKSGGRQKDVHSLRDRSQEVPEEVEAENDGIIYVKLSGTGTIGTLVNGAGLAMNTVDALMDHGGYPANFLDTGGKATALTIKASFKIITSDPRVRVIFVNIFGGLTRSDMIAEGIILAFKDLELKVPVVVRLRGTNEGLGQQMIRDSGLPLLAFDSFDEAADKVIAIANGTEKAP